MAVETIRGDIELAVGKPAHVQIVGVKGAILDDGEGLDPVELPLRLLAPESFGIGYRRGIELVVGFGVGPGMVRERSRHRVRFYLTHAADDKVSRLPLQLRLAARSAP